MNCATGEKVQATYSPRIDIDAGSRSHIDLLLQFCIFRLQRGHARREHAHHVVLLRVLQRRLRPGVSEHSLQKVGDVRAADTTGHVAGGELLSQAAFAELVPA